MKLVVSFFIVVLFLGVGSSIAAPLSVQILNSPPSLDIITTYQNYTNRTDNIPATSFSTYNDTRNVHIQVVVTDVNSWTEIDWAAVRIVYWNGSHETNFPRFGTDYVNATFEYGNFTQAIYTYNFTMLPNDSSRLGVETPPLYYRVKARVADYEYVVTSDTTDAENADYTYQGEMPSFDIDINIMDNTLLVGQTVNADVNITKLLPPTPKVVNITYELVNPLGNTTESFNETINITGSSYNRSVSFTLPSSPDGTYYLRVTVTYPEGSTTTQEAITVTYPPEEEPSGGGGGGGGGAGEAPMVIEGVGLPPIPLVELVNFPEAISVYPREKRLIAFILRNVGPEDLYEIRLELEGILQPTSIDPHGILFLPQDGEDVLIAELDIPENLAPGRYRYFVVVRAEGFQVHRSTFYLEVTPVRVDPEFTEFEILTREIENLLDTIGDLRTTILRKRAEGMNVADILSILNSAELKLEELAVLLNLREYDMVREGLAEVRGMLRDAATRAAELTPRPGAVPGVAIDLNMIILMLAVLAALLFILVVRRELIMKRAKDFSRMNVELVRDMLKRRRK